MDAPAGAATTTTTSNGSAGYPDGGCLALLLQHVASPSELAAASKPRIPQDSLAMLMMLAARDPEMLQGLGASKSVGGWSADKACAAARAGGMHASGQFCDAERARAGRLLMQH